MPKKPANPDTDQAPAPEDRPLHAPAFDPPAQPETPPDADDTNQKDVS